MINQCLKEIIKMKRLLVRKQMKENADKNAIKHMLTILSLITLTIIISNSNLLLNAVLFCTPISIYVYSINNRKIETCLDAYIQDIYDFLNGNILRDIVEK